LEKHFDKKFIQNTTSEFAEEGTAAHTLAEIKLSHEFSKKSKAAYRRELKTFMETSKYYNIEFASYVDEYIDTIHEFVEEYKDVDCVDIEQKITFGDYVPEGFGTADCVIVAEPTLHIIDLKFGKGVEVSAVDNPQLMLYALGTYLEYQEVYDFETVKMSIVQPRLYNTSTYEIPLKQLLKWGKEVVLPTAEKAFFGEGEFAPSEQACRFCPAKAVCVARAESNLHTDFDADIAQATPEVIAEWLKKTKEIMKWCADVSSFALDQAANHDMKFPGFKLVEGRSVRKLTDEFEVCKKLTAEGYEIDEIQPRKLLGLTGLEKLVGKTKLANTLDGLIIKPAGAPTLVPVSDKRPEIGSLASAEEDFSKEI
jgi:hypothetical protein